MFQIGDWVTQYSVGYWQVVDIKAKYAEEDSGYGKQFWKKGEQICKALGVLMKVQTGEEHEIDDKMASAVNVVKIDVESYTAKACIR